jgi:hypothetical protein
MRTTIVPAQITTVEDRIAGRLGLTQLLLLIAPIFGGSAIFVILPPFFAYAVYKVVLITCVAALCALLAIRIKGKILLFWAITLLRYNLRPRYYLFNKNSTHTREIVLPADMEDETTEEPSTQEVTAPIRKANLTTAERVQIEDLLANPAANVHITTTKRGELRVHLTEVQQENIGATAN